MKHDPFVSRIARWGLLMACLLLSTAATASTATKPVITSIQIEGSNVVVTIQVFEGLGDHSKAARGCRRHGNLARPTADGAE